MDTVNEFVVQVGIPLIDSSLVVHNLPGKRFYSGVWSLSVLYSTVPVLYSTYCTVPSSEQGMLERLEKGVSTLDCSREISRVRQQRVC